MSPLLLALSIVGAVAILCFIIFLVLGATKGWEDPGTRRVLRAGYLLGIVCAVLGVVVGLTGGG